MVKHNTRILVVLLSLVTSPFLSAQEWECISLEQTKAVMGEDPHIDFLFHSLDHEWSEIQKSILSQSQLSMPKSDTFVIGVVFHIISSTGRGISSDRVHQSLEWLNHAFSNIGYYDPKTGVNTGIHFCLAQRDDDQKPIDGIFRVTSHLSNLNLQLDDKELKDLSRLNPTKVINIWIVDEIRNNNSSAVAGYATLPPAHGRNNDGVVVEARFIGTSEADNGVLIHELGHYLGLYHTFQGGCENDFCTSQGDHICDTPPDQSTAWVPCSDMMNSCRTDINSGFTLDQSDMTSNYMDYSDLNCYNQFTSLQKSRMHFFLTGIRKSLIASKICLPPCLEPIVLDFDVEKNDVFVCDTVRMRNNSRNADSYAWYINGDLRSNSREFNISFENPGTYNLLLQAQSENGLCSAADSVEIRVTCPFKVQLDTVLPKCIEANIPFRLKINPTADFDAFWYLDNNLVGMDKYLDRSYKAGVYELKIVGDNGKCQDSISFKLKVGCREICNNQEDDDGDGLYDCFDPDCCGDCPDSYYDPCLNLSPQCLDSVPFGIRSTWTTRKTNYNPLYSLMTGDIDNDGQNEIIAFEDNVGISILRPNGIHKSTIHQNSADPINWSITSAIADVDNDGLSEIFCATLDRKITSYNPDGTINFISEPFINEQNQSYFDKIHIKDINLDGRPEIILSYNIYDAVDGTRHSTWKPSIKSIPQKNSFIVWDILPDEACEDCEGMEIVNGTQIMSVSSDLKDIEVQIDLDPQLSGNAQIVDWDLDGDLDVVSIIGNRFDAKLIIWEGQSNHILMQSDLPKGTGIHVVANFDKDAFPEVVVLYSGVSTFMELFDNNLIPLWETPINEPSRISPVCFDFNLDGQSEIVIRDRHNLKIIDPLNGDNLYSTRCASLTNDERPIIADIDGDGHAELVTSCQLGASYFRGTIRAFQGFPEEWPKTRRIVNQYSFFNVHVNDDLSIPSYAQNHAKLNKLQDLNSCMTQVAIPEEIDEVDLSLNIIEIECEKDSIRLTIDICSSKKEWADSMYMSIYSESNSDQIENRLLTIALDPGTFQDSFCKTISYSISGNIRIRNSICAIINDEGQILTPFNPLEIGENSIIKECEYTNNFDFISLLYEQEQQNFFPDTILCDSTLTIFAPSGFSNYIWSTGSESNTITITEPGIYSIQAYDHCYRIVEDTFRVFAREYHPLILPDSIFICPGGIALLNPGEQYTNYLWQDLSGNSTLTVFEPGEYWVTVTDGCGRKQSDTTWVGHRRLPSLGIPDTINLCAGDTVFITTKNYETVSWTGGTHLTCTSCTEAGLFPTNPQWYYVIGIDSMGCTQRDSLFVQILPLIHKNDTLETCPDKKVFFYNDSFSVGTHMVQIDAPTSCDTLVHLFVRSKPVDTLITNYKICEGDSLEILDTVLPIGQHVLQLGTSIECDSLQLLNITAYPEIFVEIITSPTCVKDSSGFASVSTNQNDKIIDIIWSDGILYNDSTIAGLAPGEYSVIIVNQFNCTQEYSFVIDTIERELVKDTITTCKDEPYYYKDSSYYSGLHNLLFSNSNGCDTEYHLFISEYSIPEISLIPLPSCHGDSTGSAKINVHEVIEFKFLDKRIKIDGDTTLKNLSTGPYEYSYTDTNGCVHHDTFFIPSYDPTPLKMEIEYEHCNTLNGIQISLDSSLNGTLKGLGMTWRGYEFNGITSGEYRMTVLDSNGCSVVDTILELSNSNYPSYSISDSVIITLGDSAVLSIDGNLGAIESVEWIQANQITCPTCFQNSVSPYKNTRFEIILLDTFGCVHHLNTLVVVKNGVDIFVPNIFTPNGDQINDRLKIYGSSQNIQVQSFSLFTRWGELIHVESNKRIEDFRGWDGEFKGILMQNGVYIYNLAFSLGDGPVQTATGTITLQR